MPTHATPPWKKQRPLTKAKTKLSPRMVAWAKARAKKAGRRYPNLIDNMAAAKRQADFVAQEKGTNRSGPELVKALADTSKRKR